MASSGIKIAPESPEFPSNLMGGLHISILSDESENGGGYGALSSTPRDVEPTQSLPSSRVAAGKGNSLHSDIVDFKTCASSSPTPTQKVKLPMVLEESESLSHREGSSVWDSSFSSSVSNASSSTASSTRAFFRRGSASADEDRKWGKPQKLRKIRRERKEASMASILLWPLKKVRDGYMSCMMGLDGAGDLSGLAQGSSYATAPKYFADLPLSKTDASNHG